MTPQKRKNYTLFSSLLLATLFATGPVLAEDVTNNQASQPAATQDQTAQNQAVDQSQAGAQGSEVAANNDNNQETPVTDPTVTEISTVKNADGSITKTSEVTSQDLESAKSDVTDFNQANRLSEDKAVELVETKVQTQPSVDAAHADNQKQASAIQEALTTQQEKLDRYKKELEQYQKDLAAKPERDEAYQKALEAYNVEKAEYDVKLKAWQEYQEQVKNDTGAGRVEKSQGLVYQSEPGAVISLEGVDNYITKEGMKEVTSDSDVLQHYNTDRYNDAMLTSENPYTGTEDTWFKMKVGQTVTATYSGLTNSKYGDKKISKVIITYKLNSSTNHDGTAIVELYHDPTKTIFIGSQVPPEGEQNPLSVTMQIRFFDEEDNEIDMSDNKAIMSLSSLNHWTSDLGDHIEKVSVGDNEFIKIPGSSVDLHGDYIYSDSQNQRKSQGATFDAEGPDGWDAINADGTPRSQTAFYGAGAMTYKGKEFTFTASGNNPYIPTTIWFSTNSAVAVPQDPGAAPIPPTPADDPVEPTEPEKITVQWHRNYVVETTEAPIPVVPVVPETPEFPQIPNEEIPKPETPRPEEPTETISVTVAAPKPAEVAPVKEAALPQTGESQGYGIMAFGVGVVVYAVLTLLGSRRLDENED
ncbi:GbpC/Spa domain-containing protein [Streptococcus dentapri]|uniref:GbpC/Spa domain-containing protein n=1 Tax=Streptococcus dentapri TaxID=573564 RepID=A0ABV8D0A1_9STRE